MGQPPYCSVAYAGLCGERGCGDGAACFAWASSIPCFQDRLAFLHRHFPSRSPPSHPLHPSLCGQQQPLPWEEPSTPAPSSCAFRGTCLSVQGMYVARTVTLLPFRLPQISCSRSALNVSPLTQTVAWLWGSDPASVSLPAEGRSSPANTPGFPFLPTSYRVLHGSLFSFPWVRSSYRLWTGVLVALLSEGVFLMYPWREMYPTFTYSSTILFSLIHFWMLIQLWVLEINPMWPLFEILFFPLNLKLFVLYWDIAG